MRTVKVKNVVTNVVYSVLNPDTREIVTVTEIFGKKISDKRAVKLVKTICKKAGVIFVGVDTIDYVAVIYTMPFDEFKAVAKLEVLE